MLHIPRTKYMGFIMLAWNFYTNDGFRWSLTVWNHSFYVGTKEVVRNRIIRVSKPPLTIVSNKENHH